MNAPPRRYVLAGLLILYAAAWSTQLAIRPDSVTYIGISKNLVEGRGYTFNDRPHVLYPPGYSLLLAALRKAGLESIGWFRLCQAGFGLAFILLSWKVLDGVWQGEQVAWAAALAAFNPEILCNAVLLQSDMPFSFLFILVVLGFSRIIEMEDPPWWGIPLTGLVVSLTCLVRMAGGGLVLGLVAALCLVQSPWGWLRRMAAAACFSAAGLAVFIPWQRYVAANKASDIGIGYQAFFHLPDLPELISRIHRAEGYLQEAILGMIVVPGLGLVLALCMAAGIFQVWRGNRGRVVVLILLAYLALISAHNEGPAPRFLLPVIPLLLLCLFVGAQHFLTWVQARFLAKKADWVRRIAVTGVAILVAVDLGYCLKQVYISHRCGDLTWYRKGQYLPYRELASWLDQQPATGQVIVMGLEADRFHPILHYWTGWITAPATSFCVNSEPANREGESVLVLSHEADTPQWKGELSDPNRIAAVHCAGDLCLYQVPQEDLGNLCRGLKKEE
jgi:4-amino-4-deoxy-L-arabinose transferase-like glycosyltransferase